MAGKTSQFNWWWFYPLTFLLKTSEVFLILFLTFVYLVTAKRIKNQKILFILMIVGQYLLLTINSKMAFGMRILLPVIGFSSLLVAEGITIIVNKQIIKMVLIFYILLSVMKFPYFFSSANFFSLLFGRKHELFADSNLDWGQDMKRVCQWVKKNGDDSISMLAHSSVPFEIFEGCNSEFEALNEADWLVISSTYYNLPSITATEEGDELLRPADLLKNFPIEEKRVNGHFVLVFSQLLIDR